MQSEASEHRLPKTSKQKNILLLNDDEETEIEEDEMQKEEDSLTFPSTRERVEKVK